MQKHDRCGKAKWLQKETGSPKPFLDGEIGYDNGEDRLRGELQKRWRAHDGLSVKQQTHAWDHM